MSLAGSPSPDDPTRAPFLTNVNGTLVFTADDGATRSAVRGDGGHDRLA
jgi:hypothetical protein